MLKLEATPLIIHPLILLFNKKVESLNNSQDFYYTMKKSWNWIWILNLPTNVPMLHIHLCHTHTKLFGESQAG